MNCNGEIEVNVKFCSSCGFRQKESSNVLVEVISDGFDVNMREIGKINSVHTFFYQGQNYRIGKNESSKIVLEIIEESK